MRNACKRIMSHNFLIIPLIINYEMLSMISTIIFLSQNETIYDYFNGSLKRHSNNIIPAMRLRIFQIYNDFSYLMNFINFIINI